jgi:hypothetical protein
MLNQGDPDLRDIWQAQRRSLIWSYMASMTNMSSKMLATLQISAMLGLGSDVHIAVAFNMLRLDDIIHELLLYKLVYSDALYLFSWPIGGF